MKRQIADRLFFGVVSLVVASMALFEPGSFSYRIVHQSGMAGELGLMLLCILAVLSLIDTIVNDLMPAKYFFKYGNEWRQMMWMLIAIAFASHAFVVIRNGVILTGVFYFLFSIRCCAVSFIDLHGKIQDKLRNRRKTDFGAFHV